MTINFRLVFARVSIFCFLLCFSFDSIAQNVNIPDANFKAALVGNAAINTNGDGEIQISEATNYNGTINVPNLNISDLTGISSFPNIISLNCNINNLTFLNLFSNVSLTSLSCGVNQLASLTLTTNTTLQELYCGDNPLVSLNVSSNLVLNDLSCSNTLLSTLDLSSNTSLSYLYCQNCQLNNLNLTSNTSLIELYCDGNPNLSCIQVPNVNIAYNQTALNNWVKDANAFYSDNCAGSYSSYPPLNIYLPCHNKSLVTCSFGTYGGNVITAKLTNLTSTTATILIEKCQLTFLNNGTGYVSFNHPNLCSGLVNGSSTFIAGANSVSITFNHNVLPGQSKAIYPTVSIPFGSGFQNSYCDSIVIYGPSTSSCITWTNPPSSTALTSSEYLCQQGIIINSQNGNFNHDSSIRRRDLARICYLGLKLANPSIMPSDSFPTPFNDMQNLNANNTYWLNAAKALSYLEYGDGISPFDRTFMNFNPMVGIEKQYAMKVFLEAFNILPDFSAGSNITDISTAVPSMYGYIKKANTLGIIPNGTFSPTLKMTREEAFIILYNILTLTAISKPSATQLTDTANYFIPNNIKLENMNKVLNTEQANFNHYEKNSFVLPGKGLPLEFTHSYNSSLTELPDEYYTINNGFLSNQNMATLGRGWNHNYNNYIFYDPGYNITSNGVNDFVDPKYYVFWSDGGIDVYNAVSNTWETKGCYNTLSFNGNKITITTKSQIRYEFFTVTSPISNFYWPSRIIDRNNNAINYQYEAGTAANTKRIKFIKDSTTNRTLTFNYTINNGLDYISKITESGLNRFIEFGYFTNGNLSTFKDAKGQITYYYYTASGNNSLNLLTEIKLPKGNTIQANYYNRKLTAVKTLDVSNTVTSSSTVNWTPTYNANMGTTTSSVSTANGANSTQTTSYIHNSQGNATQVMSPTTSINSITYDVGNNINKPKTMNVQSQVVTMNYDPVGNLLDITKNGITNTFTYTSYNDIATHTDGKGYTTTYGYTNNNLTSITRPSGGGVVSINRNSYGQPDQITNPAGIITTLGYNAFGNLNSIQLPLGISTSSTYDNASRLKTKTDAVSNTTSYDYDNNDNVWKITDALNGITELGYDLNDNNTTIKNAKNETTTKTYKFAEDLLETETFGPHTKSYAYYPDGKLQTHVKGNGTYNYVYDTQGRLSTDGHSSYTYDSRSNVATITNSNGTLNLFYDVNDRLDYYTDYYGNTVQYTYDNNHNVSTIKYPGNKVVTYTYDANNRCTQVSDWLSQVTKFYYLIDDRIDSVKYSNGTSTKYLYDAAGRNTGMNNRKANGTIINEYTYSLNNAGNHLSETMNEPVLNAGLNTLANATTTYNAMPYNRIQNAGGTTFTHNNQGQIINRATDTYTFDVNDNLLTINGSATGTFSYDGAGNRRSKTLNGTTTRYVLSILGMSQVLLETDASNNPTNYYVYGPIGLISRIKPNNTTHVYHYDYRGSTIAISDASSNLTHTYSYDPFGNVLAANEPANDLNPFRYVGQQGVQYETPTLTFMRARYADLTTGRFISEDPIWATNLYPYADNNPVMGVDPKGENAAAVSGMFIGMIESLINGAAEDAYKSTVIGAYAIKYMSEGKFTEANALSNIALKYAISANYKLIKGMALGAAGGYLGDKLVSRSILLSRFQSNINRRLGNGLLAKSGILNWLDMRYTTSKIVRDYFVGVVGADISNYIFKAIKSSFVPEVR